MTRRLSRGAAAMQTILFDLWRFQAQELCHTSKVLVSSHTYVALIESHAAKCFLIG
jgi:hypothetical protein